MAKTGHQHRNMRTATKTELTRFTKQGGVKSKKGKEKAGQSLTAGDEDIE